MHNDLTTKKYIVSGVMQNPEYTFYNIRVYFYNIVVCYLYFHGFSSLIISYGVPGRRAGRQLQMHGGQCWLLPAAGTSQRLPLSL